MKKLLLLSAFLFIGCSSDDAQVTPPIQQSETVTIVDYSFDLINSNSLGARYKMNATIHNETNHKVVGDVVCVIDSDNSTSYQRIDNVTVNAGDIVSASQYGVLYYSEYPNVVSIYFVQD